MKQSKGPLLHLDSVAQLTAGILGWQRTVMHPEDDVGSENQVCLLASRYGGRQHACIVRSIIPSSSQRSRRYVASYDAGVLATAT